MHGYSLRRIFTEQFRRLAALAAVTAGAGVASAQAPALNATRMHTGRVINEVHFQFVPDHYVNFAGDGVLYGAQIFSVAPMTNNVASETAAIGERYSDRRLTGSWSGSFGNFRFTRQPEAGPPFNQAAGILLTPPKGTNQLRVVARDLHDYNASFPHTRISLYANGVLQGAHTISTPSASGVPLVYWLTLRDSFSVRLTGAGTATVQSAYLYGSSPTNPISWGFPNISVTGNGPVQWFNMDFYGGPACDMALRVNASGVNSQTRLVVANQVGKVILEAPLTNGQNVVTTEDANPVRRVADVTRSYPTGVLPPASESRAVWGDDMKLVGPNWTKLSAAGTLSSNGSTVVLHGPVSAGTLAARILLPATYYYDSHKYLYVRVRASENCRYFIRPYIGGAEGHTKSALTALEARPGKNSATNAGWETVTFNMKTLADLYSTPARGMDRIDLIISSQAGNQASSMRLEFDYMALSNAIPADILRPSEESFTNGVDEDGDGFVDRDDPDFRVKFPVSVYVNYQTVVRRLGVIGFSGTRRPAPGQAGPTIQIDANQFTPNNPTKRTIALTYYPLDYVANPNYEPPGNYNEYWDRNQVGNWSPCGSAYAPPTQQFPGLNYQTLGSIEEYDVGKPDWVYHQARVARNHGLDGFIYNDFGYASGEPYIDTMKEVLNQQTIGAWKSKPFQLAPFYSTLGDPNSTVQTASSVLKDLIYSMKLRGMQCLSSVTFQGKPVIFIYPTSAGSSVGSTIDLNEWAQIFEGLRRPEAENFDGAFSASLAVPAAENVLAFKFNRWRTDTGTPWPGSLDRIEWLDENLIKVGETEVGTADQRPALIDGWWPLDTSTGPGQGYTEMISAETPGRARLRTTIPPNAAFLRVVLRAWGKGPEVGGQQQICELRLNTTDGAAGVSFEAKSGWNNYLFRLRNLPAGFTTAGKPVQTLPELPVSLWGMVPELVATLDEGFHRTSGFDGLADYNSLFRDARVEVNYPHLRAATVRPGFDSGGVTYTCNGLNNYFTPYNGGATYRGEWEQAIKTGADMVIITSWNEFPEGTNIEPDIERGFNPLRLTLTYSLVVKGTVQTGKMPSQTNLLFRRFDLEGDQRTIDFSLTGPDTIRIRNTAFGYAASKIVSIHRNGTPVSMGSAEAKWEGPVERPTLVINAPGGTNRYTIVYTHTPDVQRIRNSTFAPVNGGPPPEWQSLGATNASLTALSYDIANTALRAHVSSAEDVLRVTGYYTASSNEWLPYAAMGPNHYARAKFYIYAGGQSNPSALNQIPNLRLRVANRFSVTSMLEVFHHSNGDPGNAAVAAELRPSTDPSRPSIYRVDMDPIDIPYLQSHAGSEGLMRGFEVFSQPSDFQDNGYLALTESTIGIYPASLLPDSQAPIKHYKPADLSLAGGVLDIQNLILQANGKPPLVANDPPSLKGTHTHGAHGVTLDTSQVPTNRVGYVARDFNPGNNPTAPDYVRVEENKIYKVSYHLSSTRPVTANAQIRMRVRSAKFAWIQKLEIGGSWATGSEAGATIAQQSLPGPGTGNPSGWYSVLFHSPMSLDIRADGAGTLAARMPNLYAQPGPGDPGGSVRDLKVGLDLLDTLSAGPRRDEERGNVTCDQIMIRVYPQIPD